MDSSRQRSSEAENHAPHTDAAVHAAVATDAWGAVNARRTEPRARPGTEHQLRLFDLQKPVGVSVWVRLVQTASELVMSGSLRLEQRQPVVFEAVAERYQNARTAEKVTVEVARLFRFLAAYGAECWSDVTSALVLEWCWAAYRHRSGVHRRTAPARARNRQWAALIVFREAAALGVPIDPEALVGERIPRPKKVESTRPLTEDELAAAKVYADAGLGLSRRPLLLVLALAGGTASEIAGSSDLSGEWVRGEMVGGLQNRG